jgi:hypothetical protein
MKADLKVSIRDYPGAKNFNCCWCGRRPVGVVRRPTVAQISNLLYRPIAFGKALEVLTRPVSCARCGLKIRDTADWKSALQVLH